MKRQPSEWDKIFANKETDKELISRIHVHVAPQKKNTIKKWAKTKIDTSPKETYKCVKNS